MAATVGAQRKRLMKKRRKEASKGLLSWLRGAEGGRAVMLLMAVSTAALAMIRGEELRQALHDFGGISIGMTASEVRYALGSPRQELSQARQWRYNNTTHNELVTFGADGRVQRYSCSEEGAILVGCAEVLGLHIGTTERDLLLRFGGPDEIRLTGADKLLEYKGVGLDFRLRQGEVIEIAVVPAGGILSIVRQLVWMLLP